MSKIISKIITIGLVFSNMLFISGCEEYKSNEDYERGKIAQIIDGLASRDPKKVRKLFAPNAIKETTNLDDSITELFSYYKGEYVSNKWKGGSIKDSKEGNLIQKYISFSEDVVTSEDVYRFAMPNYRAKDTGDKNNVGLWQLFVIRFDDEPEHQYAYWGDKRKESGLFIGTYRIIEEVGTYE